MTEERLNELRSMCVDPTGERHKTEYNERHMAELIAHIDDITPKKDDSLLSEVYLIAHDGLTEGTPTASLVDILEKLRAHKPKMVSFRTQFYCLGEW